MWRNRDRGGKQTETEEQREERSREPDGSPLISSLSTRPESQNTARDTETAQTQRATSLWFGSLQISKISSRLLNARINRCMHIYTVQWCTTQIHECTHKNYNTHTNKLVQTLDRMQLRKKRFSSEDQLVKSKLVFRSYQKGNASN